MQIATLAHQQLRSVRALIWAAAGLMYFSVFFMAGRVNWSSIHVYIATALLGFAFSELVQIAVVRSWNLSPFRRSLLLVVSITLITAAHSIIDTLMADILQNLPALVDKWKSNKPGTALTTLLYSIQTFEFFVWIHAFSAAFAWTVIRSQLIVEQERRLAIAERQAQKAVLSALRAQVNPHFLFNTLNAIASLMTTGRHAEAEEALMRLSEFFRASLAAERRQLVTVADELEMLEAYLEMEQLRFPDRLKARISMGQGSDTGLMPSFLLQPLVENAIKYAVAPSTEPIDVIVASNKEGGILCLSVEDNGNAPIPAASAGEGVGLENVRSRIEALYGSSGSVTIIRGEPGFRVTIRLPFSNTAASEPTS